MNIERLNTASRKELADEAKSLGIEGYTSMKKEELVKAVQRALKKREKDREKAKQAATASPKSKAAPTPSTNGKHAAPAPAPKAPAKAAVPPTPPKPVPVIRPPAKLPPGVEANGVHHQKPEIPNPAVGINGKAHRHLQGNGSKDRIVVIVRDPFWLHVFWELTHHAVQRAEAALGQDWHGSRPILRLYDVSSQDTTSTAEATVRDIDIHGGCNNWYLEVAQPPKSYRVDIGYLSKRNQFYVLSRSNIVTPPKAGQSDAIDENWTDIDAKQADRLYAMSNGFETPSSDKETLKEFFEERLRRPLNAPTLPTATSSSPSKDRKFFFSIDAEMIVFGKTIPGTRVTLQGEPVKLRPDGSFTMRYSFPDGRQILPCVAESADGVEERKIVLAVERNTKELEPLINDGNESNN